MRKPMANVIVTHRRRRRHSSGKARVVRAPDDGYTLLVHHIGLATAPALYKNLSYKNDQLEFLGLINEAPSTLIGKQALPATNFAELRKYIAASGGKINLANAGVGSASHLCSLLLQNALKSDMVFVPYRARPGDEACSAEALDVRTGYNRTPQIG